MFSYVSPKAYRDVTAGGNRGNFLAVIGRAKTDMALMAPLEKHYENGKDQFVSKHIQGTLGNLVQTNCHHPNA